MKFLFILTITIVVVAQSSTRLFFQSSGDRKSEISYDGLGVGRAGSLWRLGE